MIIYIADRKRRVEKIKSYRYLIFSSLLFCHWSLHLSICIFCEVKTLSDIAVKTGLVCSMAYVILRDRI